MLCGAWGKKASVWVVSVGAATVNVIPVCGIGGNLDLHRGHTAAPKKEWGDIRTLSVIFGPKKDEKLGKNRRGQNPMGCSKNVRQALWRLGSPLSKGKNRKVQNLWPGFKAGCR